MKPAVVRLPDLDRKNHRVYILNWLGRVTYRDRRLRICASFVADPVTGGADSSFEAWIRLSDLPFLIIGSRWFRGVMVGKPLGLQTIELATTRIESVIGVSHSRPGRALLEHVHPLSGLKSPGPLLEFTAKDGARVFLPLAELYRSHYLCIPRTLQSITGGLIKDALSNPEFAAWDPADTHWIEEAAGIAQIAPAPFIPEQHAKRLARLIFSPFGRKSLEDIHAWMIKEFAQPMADVASAPEVLLPIIKVPYPRGLWHGSVHDLPPDPNGRPRLLVLHLERFDAPEPFRELVVVEPRPPRDLENSGNGGGGGRRADTLEPDPKDPTDDVESGWDPALEPVVVDDVLPRDEATNRRRALRKQREPGVSNGGSRPGRDVDVDVDAASTDPYGRRGSGIAPIVFSDGDWDARTQSLDASYEAIRAAADSLIRRYRERGLSAGIEFIPDDTHACAFRVPASDSSRALAVAVPRQYVIAELKLNGKYLYAIDPEQRCDTDSFPLGIVWRPADDDARPAFVRMDSGDLNAIVCDFESSARAGLSWTRLPGLERRAKALAVPHPSESRSAEEAKILFSRRIEKRLIEIASDLVG